MPVACMHCGNPIDDPAVRVAHQAACGLNPDRDETARARYDDVTDRLRQTLEDRA